MMRAVQGQSSHNMTSFIPYTQKFSPGATLQAIFLEQHLDTDPLCRVYVHMFTITQFLRARANIHTIHRKSELENSYQPISCFVWNTEILIPQNSCFFIAYNLRSRLITICPWDLWSYIVYKVRDRLIIIMNKPMFMNWSQQNHVNTTTSKLLVIKM